MTIVSALVQRHQSNVQKCIRQDIDQTWTSKSFQRQIVGGQVDSRITVSALIQSLKSKYQKCIRQRQDQEIRQRPDLDQVSSGGGQVGGCFQDYSVSFGPESLELYIEMQKNYTVPSKENLKTLKHLYIVSITFSCIHHLFQSIQLSILNLQMSANLFSD